MEASLQFRENDNTVVNFRKTCHMVCHHQSGLLFYFRECHVMSRRGFPQESPGAGKYIC